MTSRHWWPAPLPFGADLLAVVCVACGRPLVPMPSPDDWPRRVAEFANRGDCPGNGLDRIEGQNMPEDHEPDPGDTMPAQGWLELPSILPHSWAACPRSTFAEHVTSCPFWPIRLTQRDFALVPPTDAGRLPAPREEHTMASPRGTIESAELREDFGSAADRASTIAQFATMDHDQRDSVLEDRSVRDLRELAHQASATQAWHKQGQRDAEALRTRIADVLRQAGDGVEPMMATAESVGVLR